MLGNSYSGSGDNEGGACRDVERSGSIASGAACIHQSFAAGSAGVECSIVMHRNWSCGRADRFGEADDLFHGLAFHMETNQQCRNLRVSTLAGEHLFHYRAGLFARERLTMSDNAMEGLDDHMRAEDCKARNAI